MITPRLFLRKFKNYPYLIFCLLAAPILGQDPNFYIFLAFGQSNMEGNASVESQDRGNVDERFQFLSAVDCPNQNRSADEWSTAEPPLCRCGTGLNPCDYFGRTLVDSLPEEIRIGVINVSVAGCAIEMFDKDKYQSYITNQADWMKNISNEYGGNPYGRLVELGQLAQQEGVIKGFLLHQGESGSSTNNWAGEVEIIYNNLVEDLGLEGQDIPLLVGDLVRPSTMIQNLPGSMDNAYVISSNGLSDRGDGLHFDALSYREFGRRYAETMLELLPEPSTGVGAPKGSPVGLWSHIAYQPGRISLTFEIPREEYVSVFAQNLAGQKIGQLMEGYYASGVHTLKLANALLPEGMFVLQLQAGKKSNAQIIGPTGLDP